MTTSNKRYWLALIPALTLPFFAALYYFVLSGNGTGARTGYVVTKVFTIIWPIIALRFILHEKFPKLDFSLRRHMKTILPGIASGTLIVATMYILLETPLGQFVWENEDKIRDKARTLRVDEYFVPFSIFLAIFHSLIEEYYWRWFGYGFLRRVVTARNAHLIAGVAFAAHHVVIVSQFSNIWYGLLMGVFVAMGGILWSLMYEEERSLVGVWISHMIVDFGVLEIGHRVLYH